MVEPNKRIFLKNIYMKIWQLENHRKLTLLAIFNFHLANWENLARKKGNHGSESAIDAQGV
jgi:hypothetical protein